MRAGPPATWRKPDIDSMRVELELLLVFAGFDTSFTDEFEPDRSPSA